MKSGLYILTFIFFLLPAVRVLAQAETFPEPPKLKSYKGVPGKISKYNNFNYLDVRDEAGKNNRQCLGHYWEIAYNYDSVFRQKNKFRDFMQTHVAENNGSVFYQDTTQVNFVIPSEAGNIWGRMVLSNDKGYRMRLIRETTFVNTLVFDVKPTVVFEKFVDAVALPPRVNYLPKSAITRIQYSKYDHQQFSWNVKDTLYKEKVMGPFWDIKCEVRNDKNTVDKQVSTVEIMESYFRACTKAGGKVLKSRPRELLFTLPLDKATLWCRLTVSLDGVYFLKIVTEADQDKSQPEKMLVAPAPVASDSTKIKIDG